MHRNNVLCYYLVTSTHVRLSLYLGILNGPAVVVIVDVARRCYYFATAPPPPPHTLPLPFSRSPFHSHYRPAPGRYHSIEYHFFHHFNATTRVWFLCSNCCISLWRFCFVFVVVLPLRLIAIQRILCFWAAIESAGAADIVPSVPRIYASSHSGIRLAYWPKPLRATVPLLQNKSCMVNFTKFDMPFRSTNVVFVRSKFDFKIEVL